MATAEFPTHHHDIIVVGGSYGSLDALKTIVQRLPQTLAATVFVVQHLAPGANRAEHVLAPLAALPLTVARQGDPVVAGSIRLAPADHHLLLEGGGTRVVRGPRENMARPSIDVLFRSAAVAYSSRVVGVLLSGALDDGVAGLDAIVRCGGVAVVQDPDDALNGDLPRAALRGTVHHKLPASEIAGLLAALVPTAANPAARVPSDVRLEARAASAAMDEAAMAALTRDPARLSCPECGGPLWRVSSAPGEHFRCDVGHGFSGDTLLAGQSLAIERALWIAYRTLVERRRLLQHMDADASARGHTGSAQGFSDRITELDEHARAVLGALTALDAPQQRQLPANIL